MSDIRRQEERKSFSEETGSLWLITFACSAWALHFVVSYAATAIVCAKFAGDPQSVLLLRAGLGGLTGLTLIAIAWIGWRSWLQWDYLDDFDTEHDQAKTEHRHEFLGHASFLLSIISFIGVCYGALPILILETCR